MTKQLIFTMAFGLSLFLSTAQEVVPSFKMPRLKAIAHVNHIRQLPNNQTLLFGMIDYYGDQSVTSALRINADGSLDSSFQFTVSRYFMDVGLLANGDIIAVDRDSLYRINEIGEITNALRLPEDVNTGDIEIKDDKVYLLTNEFGLQRYSADLVLDQDFNNDNSFNGDWLLTLAFQGDSLLVAGTFTDVNGIARAGIARFTLAGELDTTFHYQGGVGFTTEMAVQPDGKVLFYGGSDAIDRLNADGSDDDSFNPAFTFNGAINEIVIQGDKILIASFIQFNDETNWWVVRFNSDGSEDDTFERILGYSEEIALLEDDGFITSISTSQGGLAKYDANGSLDNTYAPPIARYGLVTEADLHEDFIVFTGDFYQVGDVSTYKIAKMDLMGQVDPAFVLSVEDLDIGQENRSFPEHIEIVGPEEIYVSLGKRVLKLNDVGDISPDFQTDLDAFPFFYNANTFEVLEDGSFLTGAQHGIFRMDAMGNYDSTFQANVTGGAVGPFGYDRQSDGRILFGGFFDSFNNTEAPGLVRLNSDLTVDEDFVNNLNAEDGVTLQVNRIHLLPNDEILLGALQGPAGLSSGSRLYKLGADGKPDSIFVNNINDDLSFTAVAAVATFKSNRFLLSHFFARSGQEIRSRVVRMGFDGSKDDDFQLAFPFGFATQRRTEFFGILLSHFFRPLVIDDKRVVLFGTYELEGEERKEGVMLFDNIAPEILSADPLTLAEDDTLSLSITDLEYVDPDDTDPMTLELIIQQGPNYTVEGNQVIPSTDFNGTLNVSIQLSDGFDLSNTVSMTVEVTPINDAPVIAGADTLFVAPNSSVTVALSDLQVDDPDNSFPDDFSLIVLDGENYTFDGNEVSPDLGFEGTLQVNVVVTDGTEDSEAFSVVVIVDEPLSVQKRRGHEVSVYPNPSAGQFTVRLAGVQSDMFLEVLTISGQRIHGQSLKGDEVVFDLSHVNPGIYFLHVTNQRNRSSSSQRIVIK